MCTLSLISVITTLLVISKGVDSLVCLSCDDVANARDCGFLTNCGSHEVCYHTAKVSDTGRITRKLGCRDKLQCKKPASLTGRRRGKRADVTLCDSCCDADFCQTKLCSDKDFEQPHGPICYACETQKDQQCNKFHICGRDEVCFETLAPGTGSSDSVKSTKCFSKTACSLLAGFGKRATTNSDTCLNCCSTDLCNNNCTMAQPTTTQASLATVSIGGGGGPTPAPCVDLTAPAICKVAEKFVCHNRTKADNANCLHYCKFC